MRWGSRLIDSNGRGCAADNAWADFGKTPFEVIPRLMICCDGLLGILRKKLA